MSRIAQRPLLEQLKVLIDHASAKGAGASRDVAKSNLRVALRDGNWDTVYVLYNLGVRRCRYLRSIGYPVPGKYLYASENDVQRIIAHNEKER